MIKLSVRKNPPDLEKIISDAPRNARGKMTHAAAVYLVGNDRRGLRHYAQYKYVTRKRAYGRSFFSDKQRAYVMAKIRSGEITPGKPRRTFSLRDGWKIVGSGADSRITNSARGAEFVMGDRQARQPKLVGWRWYMQVANDNIKGMIQAADRELTKYFRERGVTIK